MEAANQIGSWSWNHIRDTISWLYCCQSEQFTADLHLWAFQPWNLLVGKGVNMIRLFEKIPNLQSIEWPTQYTECRLCMKRGSEKRKTNKETRTHTIENGLRQGGVGGAGGVHKTGGRGCSCR